MGHLPPLSHLLAQPRRFPGGVSRPLHGGWATHCASRK